MVEVSYIFQGMNNVDDPADVGAPDPSSRKLVYTKAVRLLNFDTDNDGGLATRPGRSQVLAGTFRGGWGDDRASYVVVGNGIYAFDGVGVSLKSVVLDVAAPVCFCRVNDEVLFSDGSVLNFVGAATPETPTKAFKVPMQPGYCLTFYHGRALSASGASVYCSDFGNALVMDERKNVVATLDQMVSFILPVDDGVYVADLTETFFLPGKDAVDNGGFGFTSVCSYGAPFGTGIITKAEKIKAVKGATGAAVVWRSNQGICVGLNGGNVINLSLGEAALEIGLNGAGFIREQDGLIHYISLVRANAPAFNRNPLVQNATVSGGLTLATTASFHA